MYNVAFLIWVFINCQSRVRIPGFSSYVCIVMVYITLFYFHAFADVMSRDVFPDALVWFAENIRKNPFQELVERFFQEVQITHGPWTSFPQMARPRARESQGQEHLRASNSHPWYHGIWTRIDICTFFSSNPHNRVIFQVRSLY